MSSVQEFFSAVAFLLAVAALVVIGITVTREWQRSECAKFCGASEHGSHYSWYGCFCIDEDGKRYNPEMLGLECGR